MDSWQQKFEIKQQKIEIEQQNIQIKQQKIEQDIQIKQLKIEQEQNKMRLELQKGVWCGFTAEWKRAYAKIRFETLLHSSTNMKNTGNGLNIESGKGLCFNHCIIF